MLRFAEGLAPSIPPIDDTQSFAPNAEAPLVLTGPARRRKSTSVLRRALVGLFTLLVISFLIFFAAPLLPGNAARAILGYSATPVRA